MNFLYPYILYGLIVPALLAAVAWILMKKQSRKWEVLVSPNYRSELVANTSALRRSLPLAFGAISLALLILALARPYSGTREVEQIHAGNNILIALDCSRSMMVEDVTPSRLERAKTTAFDLIDAQPEDNFGLIIFSGEAFLLLPFTHDTQAVKEAIDQVDYGWIGRGGTNLDDVLAQSIKACERLPDKDSTNALIIFSDGEDTVNTSYQTIQQARDSNLIVITVGVGTTSGGYIPDARQRDGRYRDSEGEQVLAKLDPSRFRQLAEKTGGKYFQLSSGQPVTQFVKSLSDHLTKQEIALDKRTIPNDRYELFAIPSLICLLLALLTGTKWRNFRRIAKHAPVILLLFTLSSLTAQGKENQDEAGMTPAEAFSQGCQALENKDTLKAAQYFSDALLSPNPTIQAAAHYNLGNTIAERGLAELPLEQEKAQIPGSPPQPLSKDEIEKIQRTQQLLKEAIEHYQDSLNLVPASNHALSNKEKLEQYIEELQKILDQDKQDQNKQDQNKQDQNKQDQPNEEDKGTDSNIPPGPQPREGDKEPSELVEAQIKQAKEDRQKRDAARILKEHADVEQGPPFPMIRESNRPYYSIPPTKDY